MSEFKLVDIGSLPREQQEEAIVRIWKIYYKAVQDQTLFDEFKKKTLSDGVKCVVKGEKLFGVVSYKLSSKELFVQEIWALPSREFLREHKMTIGRFLNAFMTSVAIKKGVSFRRTGGVGAGVRFRKRLEGKLPQKPHLPQRRK